jgi:hypothetical protein
VLRSAAAAIQATMRDVASERRTRRLGCTAAASSSRKQHDELGSIKDCCVGLTFADLVAQMRRRLQTGPPTCRVGDVIGVVALARAGLGCASARHTENEMSEATREIRAFESKSALPRVPIIAVTAGALESEQAECLVAGMDSVVVKPILREKLFAVLSTVMANKQTERIGKVGASAS